MDSGRKTAALVGSACKIDIDCNFNMFCEKQQCACSVGFQQSPDRKCFRSYNANCTVDYQCLKYGVCRQDKSGHSKCQCSPERTVYVPNLKPHEQCILSNSKERLAGAECGADGDCIQDLKCNKYCSCNEIDLYFEQTNFFCADGCANKPRDLFGAQPVQYAHPTKCGFYYTCSPRKLLTCPSGYRFNEASQSCDHTKLCKHSK